MVDGVAQMVARRGLMMKVAVAGAAAVAVAAAGAAVASTSVFGAAAHGALGR